jgi:hypothetical protein
MRSLQSEPFVPATPFLVVHHGGDSRVEWDIPAQIKLVGQTIQIAFVLKLTGIVLLLLPFPQQFLENEQPWVSLSESKRQPG